MPYFIGLLDHIRLVLNLYNHTKRTKQGKAIIMRSLNLISFSYNSLDSEFLRIKLWQQSILLCEWVNSLFLLLNTLNLLGKVLVCLLTSKGETGVRWEKWLGCTAWAVQASWKQQFGQKEKLKNFNCQHEPPNGINKKQIKTIDYNYILSKGSLADISWSYHQKRRK